MPSRRNSDARRRRHHRHQPQASERLSPGTPTPKELPGEPRPHEPDRCAARTSPPTTNSGVDRVGRDTSHRIRCTTPKHQRRRRSGAAAPTSLPLAPENDRKTSPTPTRHDAPPRHPAAMDLGERPRSPHTTAHRRRRDVEDRPGSGSPATCRARPTGRARSAPPAPDPPCPRRRHQIHRARAGDTPPRRTSTPPPGAAGGTPEHQNRCAESCASRTGRGAAPAANTAARPAVEIRGRRPGALLRHQKPAVQGAAPQQPETPARGGGGPAAAGYLAGFARRRRPTAARRTEEGGGGLCRFWFRPCRPLELTRTPHPPVAI
jgi:hypothetical protein